MSKVPENIVKAIQAAEGPGQCSYEKGCVIGQLCKIEFGHTVREKCGEFYSIKVNGEDVEKHTDSCNVFGLASLDILNFPYSIDNLTKLQNFWDSSDHPDVSTETYRGRLLALARTLDWEV